MQERFVLHNSNRELGGEDPFIDSDMFKLVLYNIGIFVISPFD